ncbi:sulfatase-like hydrolase/transferase [bacterium]|nr:sulfatase-like hydrolase/transferase [bacterium]
MRLSRPLLLCVVCLAVLSVRIPVVAAERPNVLFIAVDDLNDWIGCLGGHPDGQSPNIDALASRGLLFDRSYCSAPACNPSRVALLTGMRPSTTGVYVNPQPWRPVLKDAVTLPQHFMANGYHAVGCGKIFHGAYDDDASWHEYLKKGGDPKPTKEVANDPHSKAGGIVWGVLDVKDSEMNDYRMADYAIDYLSKPHDKPFFLACGIYRPHMPWQVPRAYYDLFPAEKVTLPKVLAGDLDDVPPAGVRMARPQGDHATILKTNNWNYAVQAYLASIRFADAQVGRLIKALDDSDYAKNTIIVLWGDHGWHLGEKEHWRKFSLWEEACRAPLMIVAPGVTKAGTRSPRTVDFVDLYPTLSELCGLPIGNHLDGDSLVPLLKNPNADWSTPALTTHGIGNHSVRSERWRYTRYANGDEELYDHDADPMEWKNLASDPKLKSIKEDLARWIPAKDAPEAPYDSGLSGGNRNGNSKKSNSKKNTTKKAPQK